MVQSGLILRFSIRSQVHLNQLKMSDFCLNCRERIWLLLLGIHWLRYRIKKYLKLNGKVLRENANERSLLLITLVQWIKLEQVTYFNWYHNAGNNWVHTDILSELQLVQLPDDLTALLLYELGWFDFSALISIIIIAVNGVSTLFLHINWYIILRI